MSRFLHVLTIATIIIFFERCADESLQAPKVLSPINEATFYPDQEIEIKWQLSDPGGTVEMEMWTTRDSLFLKSGIVPLRSMHINRPQKMQFRNQNSYKFIWDSNLNETFYYGFRLRYKTVDDISRWTSMYYFKVLPYTSLSVKYMTIKANFNFIAQESNNYYSGETTSDNFIDLDKELLNNGYSINNLEMIKLDSGFIEDKSEYAHHLEQMDFGFTSAQNQTLPFDLWGGARSINYKPQIIFAPFGGRYRDVYDEIGGKSLQMKAVYHLSTNYNKADQIGKPHKVDIIIRLRCYYK